MPVPPIQDAKDNGMCTNYRTFGDSDDQRDRLPDDGRATLPGGTKDSTAPRSGSVGGV